VLADQGLFVYSGTTFPLVPMNYFQHTDMLYTISGVTNVSIKDFAQEQVVLVQTGVSIGTIYAFNYQDGMTPQKVRASKWTSTAFPP